MICSKRQFSWKEFFDDPFVEKRTIFNKLKTEKSSIKMLIFCNQMSKIFFQLGVEFYQKLATLTETACREKEWWKHQQHGGIPTDSSATHRSSTHSCCTYSTWGWQLFGATSDVGELWIVKKSKHVLVLQHMGQLVFCIIPCIRLLGQSEQLEVS